MNKYLMMMAMIGAMVSLTGCVIAPQGRDGYQNDQEAPACTQVDDANGRCGQKPHPKNASMITRDGVTLPDCQAIPDASQADNGSRCWYR